MSTEIERRLRLYLEITSGLGAIGYDERFTSEEWPRKSYAPSAGDLNHILRELDRVRRAADSYQSIIQQLQIALRGAQGAQELLAGALLDSSRECACGRTQEGDTTPGHGDMVCVEGEV